VTNYVDSVAYAAHGAISSLGLHNGVTETTVWDPLRLQPQKITAAKPSAGFTLLELDNYFCPNLQWTACSTNNGNVLNQATQVWNTSGQQTLNAQAAYSYDGLNRLQSAAETQAGTQMWLRPFNYDPYGNMWLTSTPATDGQTVAAVTPTAQSWFQDPTLRTTNRIVGLGYDTAGNQTASGDGKGMSYDAENRLVQVTGPVQGTVTFTYDGQGRRVSKTVGSATTWYVYDATGELAAEYGTPSGNGGTMYLTADHLGSTRLVTDSTGACVSQHDYLPFGEEIDPTQVTRPACYGAAASDGVTEKFTGKERDAETGLDFFNARYMSSAQGRFMSPDPLPWLQWQHSHENDGEEEQAKDDRQKFKDFLGNPQNFNMYAYVMNNPLSHNDPTGMSGCKAGDKEFTTCTITVTYDPTTSKGTLVVTGQNKGDKEATTLLTADVVVGGDGHVTPTGTFTASVWEKDHVSKLYGSAADTPWSKTALGGNAFGPYQLHIKELDSRGIFIHGTMGPSWSPTTWGNSLFLSPTSHGCVRMCNRDDLTLHDIMPNPSGNRIIINAIPPGTKP
jgi:RHS repeat-associated protein